MFSTLTSFIVFTGQALAANTMTINDSSAAPGDVNKVMEVEFSNEDVIGGWQLAVHFPPAVVQIQSVSPGPYGTELTMSHQEHPDNVMSLAFSMSGTSISPGNGVLFSITYNVAEDAPPGEYSFSPQNAVLSDEVGQPLAIEVFSGTLTITGDADQDGHNSDVDCDDGDAAVFPGAEEICDGIDNNCDTQIDEGVLLNFYEDADGDGHGNPDVSVEDCTEPVGFVSNNTDCDDSNPDAWPGSEEIPDNQIDEDCDGSDQTTPEPGEPSGEDTDSDGGEADQLDGDDSNEKAGSCSHVNMKDIGFMTLMTGIALIGLRRKRL